jgi:Ni/Fe-hydrogenase subunit HybB-like protein
MNLGQPVGPLALTRPIKILALLSTLGVAAITWRLAAGLGDTTALNDGYPWGIWIAFDVVTGTAFACGGYVIALMVYVFNKGQYHNLIRPALLTSALGYTMAGVSVALDVGKPFTMWKVPLYFWHWNLNSALLEVALCIIAYVMVIWIELLPAPLDKWRRDPHSKLHRFAARVFVPYDRILTWVIGFALLLPAMHQSSLGTLMVLSGPRLHDLWQTPLLPLLFLVSCISMGFAAVVLENTLAHYFLKRPIETAMLGRLAGVVVPLQAGYILIRLADVAWRGELGTAFSADPFALLFWFEIALFAAPAVMLAGGRALGDATHLFRAAMLLVAGGALYRFDAFLIAFQPGAHYRYFPSVGELAVTVGLVSMEILAYVIIVHYYPILSGAAHAPVVADARV